MKVTKKLWLICIVLGCICLTMPMKAYATKTTTSSTYKFKKYEDTLTIKKGESIGLKVLKGKKKVSNKKIKWTTSKAKVVSVSSSGVIKGKKKGKATITATNISNSKLKVKLKVTVGTKVESITFVEGNDLTELNVGKTSTFKVAVAPAKASNKAIRWTSSNEAVATVDKNGKVKGIGAGRVTITGAAADGSGVKVQHTFEVKIFVSKIALSIDKPGAYASNIGSSAGFVKKGRTYIVKAAITPEDATNKQLYWTTSNPEVVSVDQMGNISALSCGAATITAYATDEGKKKATFTVFVAKMDSNDCKFIAHRGKSEDAPANSLAAIRLGLESGFDGVEFDVWETIDHEFAVTHDESLKDMCSIDVKVTELTLAQAKCYRIVNGNNVDIYPNENIASVDDVLDLAKSYPDKTLSIELKSYMTEEGLTNLMKKIDERKMQEQVRLITFHRSNIAIVRGMEDLGGDTIAVEYLSSNPNEDAVNVCITYNAVFGAKYIGLTEAQVKKLHENDIRINAWTMPSFFSAYHMIHTMEVDYITTDYQLFE